MKTASNKKSCKTIADATVDGGGGGGGRWRRLPKYVHKNKITFTLYYEIESYYVIYLS